MRSTIFFCYPMGTILFLQLLLLLSWQSFLRSLRSEFDLRSLHWVSVYCVYYVLLAIKAANLFGWSIKWACGVRALARLKSLSLGDELNVATCVRAARWKKEKYSFRTRTHTYAKIISAAMCADFTNFHSACFTLARNREWLNRNQIIRQKSKAIRKPKTTQKESKRGKSEMKNFATK